MNNDNFDLEKLFLKNSYIDAYNNYLKSIETGKGISWDIIVITASNKNQAASYEKQITLRKENNMLPANTKFYVIPDYNDERIGSGGSTLQVLSYLKENTECKNGFENKKILILHSGGDSKRIPQYSAIGKLFANVPHKIFENMNSTIFDELMITLSGLPSRMNSGVFISSGDIIMLFNATQLDFHFDDVCCVSIKAPYELGTRHGVFKANSKNVITEFLHKQSYETLLGNNAIDEYNKVNIDSGAVYFSTNAIEKLLKLIYKNDKLNKDMFKLFINKNSRISLYGDFLYAMSEKATLESYKKQSPDGDFCPELEECRIKIYEALNGTKMHMSLISPAEFIHFGSTKEFLNLMNNAEKDYYFISWYHQISANGFGENISAINSMCKESTTIGEKTFIEDSIIDKDSNIGKNCIISSTLFKGTLPDNIVISTLPLINNKYITRIYGINDNPKNLINDNSFIGANLLDVLKKHKIPLGEIISENNASLWTAKLYPICDNEEDTLENSKLILKMIDGTITKKEIQQYINSPKMSLNDSYQLADIDKLLKRRKEIKEQITTMQFIDKIKIRKSTEECIKTLGTGEALKENVDNLLRIVNNIPLEIRYRIYFTLMKLKGEIEDCCDLSEQELEDLCFGCIGEIILNSTNTNIKERKGKHKKATIKLPVRVNFGGAWTDTPPYCLENGGIVLNASIKLKGKLPVVVEVELTDKDYIEFVSKDLNSHRIITNIEELQGKLNTSDIFSLHKASLIMTGIIRKNDKSLKEVLKELGGGLKITSDVDIPKGSGLGTSSILSCALVLSIEKLLGIRHNSQRVLEYVLCMEQLITSGGGWQDQAGVLYPGFKLNKTLPGPKQINNPQLIEISENSKQELNERFALIYTGQRRLAKNLLRTFMGNYLNGDDIIIKSMYEIRNNALIMAYELEIGNIDNFAKLLNKQWELTKTIDKDATNEIIDLIISSCSHLIDGVLIAGAGGGGFLEVILKKGCTKKQLSKLINEKFSSTGIEVWDTEFVYNDTF